MNCTRDISRAIVGYTVYIDASAVYRGQTSTATIGFTPQQGDAPP